MQMRLDRKRAFGTVTPPEAISEDDDRYAYYAQDGQYFDQHGLAIGAGDVPVAEPDEPDDAGPAVSLTPKALLDQADALPWAQFRSEAKRILGPDCPGGKAAIVKALADAIAAYEAKVAKRAPAPKAAYEPANGLTWGGITGQHQTASGIDLAAWARGQKDYLFGEVQKGIRARHSTGR